MGSPISPALAIAVCSKLEHEFLQKHPHSNIQGWRFMDDLLMFIDALLFIIIAQKAELRNISITDKSSSKPLLENRNVKSWRSAVKIQAVENPWINC